jgi:hypothetical protein
MPEADQELEESYPRAARLSSESLLTAILALIVDEREHGALHHDKQRRVEVVLADAGLPPALVSRVLNRNAGAVRMAIKRERDRRNKSPGAPTAPTPQG